MNEEIHYLQALLKAKEDIWFNSLKVGDKVYNYYYKWENHEVVEEKLREGIIKEIHNLKEAERYVIVDNITTGRQNKWYDYSLDKPAEIQQIKAVLNELIPSLEELLHEESAEQKERRIHEERNAKLQYGHLLSRAEILLKNKDIREGKCRGVYGAFNIATDECIYIGTSSLIRRRWHEHSKAWKKGKPIHRQQILTKYIYFFGNQIAWRVLLPVDESIDRDMLEYCERRLFEKYRPIANSIIPNGTYYGRSILESGGAFIPVSEWNSYMVDIRVRKGMFNGFSDGKNHFLYK